MTRRRLPGDGGDLEAVSSSSERAFVHVRLRSVGSGCAIEGAGAVTGSRALRCVAY
jgi:hypothetical protein